MGHCDDCSTRRFQKPPTDSKWILLLWNHPPMSQSVRATLCPVSGNLWFQFHATSPALFGPTPRAARSSILLSERTLMGKQLRGRFSLRPSVRSFVRSAFPLPACNPIWRRHFCTLRYKHVGFPIRSTRVAFFIRVNLNSSWLGYSAQKWVGKTDSSGNDDLTHWNN